MVVDAISPDKAVWIVSNTTLMNDIGHRIPVDKGRIRNAFPRIKEGFAIARIARSLDDWLDRRLEDNAILQSVRNTMEFVRPKLSMVTEMDIAAARCR